MNWRLGSFFNDAVIGVAYVLNDANVAHICSAKHVQFDEELNAVCFM